MPGVTRPPSPPRPPRLRFRAPALATATAVLAAAAAVLAAAGPAAMLLASPALAGTAPAAQAAPPPVTILAGNASKADGDFFISPYGDQGSYANGPEILSPDGKVIWFHAVPAGQEASDFRTQIYDGQPVLTWWQGTGLGGLSQGTDHIYNDRYQQIATVQAGNGYSADGHEFLITPWNTALVLAYTTATANLTSIGGPADQTVIDGIVQEIDIKTGKVLFQWNSADHVPYSESEQPLPASASTPWDWFHINAVKVTANGSLLIDGRDTWTSYDVSLRTGRINWQLGGKDSTFTEVAGPGQVLDNASEVFAWQHDPQQVGPDEYTFFDNESSGTAELPASRVVTVRLNFRTKVATLVSSIDQPEGLVAASQGNAQTTRNGDVVVGWGALPYFSAFSRSGTLLFNAEFPAGVNTYRAYQLPWPPPPARPHHHHS
jgi:Arylsulfotransferase (ASST)